MAPLPPKSKRGFWRNQAFRARLVQGLAIIGVAALVWFLARNTLHNMQLRGIQSGFDFLADPAGFDIGESLFPFDSGQSYWRAFGVGLSNTLRVALLGIVFTTLLGTLLGVGRFSRNALVRGVCYAYVEVFRNVPVLLQLLMWYLLFTEALPAAAEAWTLGPMFLSKGGLSFPIPVWPAEGIPFAFDYPVKGEFAIENGGSLTPEFLTVLLGLTAYTAAFVAEVVRAGIASVDRGQREAAVALGLSPSQSMRLVMLPQALRVIIPPMTNQFLNLTKNSSLAVAVGYPDVVSIANTALNQTGRAVECLAIVMVVYLCTSLLTAWLMHRYNRRSAIKER